MPGAFNFSSLSVPLQGMLATISLWDILDISIVALILYKLYEMLQDTRAITLAKGILVLLFLMIVTGWLNLHAVNWLLEKTTTLLFVALPIVFQPELRRTLEHVGQGRFLGKHALLDESEAQYVINELDRAVFRLSNDKTGALLVFEREMGLGDIIATGIQIDGLITADFLMNVFIPNTPLHDGAAIIRGKRLVAAGCLLPLTENHNLSTELGTRHRAAIGLSEQTDALIVVVSEETGTVSVAEDGHIDRHLDSTKLREYLTPIFARENDSLRDKVRNWRRGK